MKRKDGKRKRRKSGRKAVCGKGRRNRDRKARKARKAMASTVGKEKGNRKPKGRKLKRRKWQKRGIPGARPKLITKVTFRKLEKGVRRIFWSYRKRDMSLEDMTAEVDLTRPAFTKILRFGERRFYFSTFLQIACMLRECAREVCVVEDGWELRMNWSIQRCSCGSLCLPPDFI